MRKTFPSHVLAELTSTKGAAQDKPKASRRKRAVKAAAPIATAATETRASRPTVNDVFDRLAQTLQPALDDVDTAWA